MTKYSELKVIFSNCLSGGTAWNEIGSELVEKLYSEMLDVNALEFKKINSNTVRGEHNSFTLVLTGVFFIQQSREPISKLLEYLRNAANKIASLTYTEIRIEHTRYFSIFQK